MLVRLTAKLADVVNGVDLSRFREGEVVDLPELDCQMLIAERWAEPVRPPARGHCRRGLRAVAADRKPRHR